MPLLRAAAAACAHDVFGPLTHQSSRKCSTAPQSCRQLSTNKGPGSELKRLSHGHDESVKAELFAKDAVLHEAVGTSRLALPTTESLSRSEGCNGDDSDIVAYVHGVERAHHRVRIRPLDRCLPAGQVEAYQILVADFGIEIES